MQDSIVHKWLCDSWHVARHWQQYFLPKRVQLWRCTRKKKLNWTFILDHFFYCLHRGILGDWISKKNSWFDYKLYLIFIPSVANQNFEIRVIDEFILLGNSAIMKCLLPSFVADFVQVTSWLIIDDDESTEISVSHNNFGKTLVELLIPFPFLMFRLGFHIIFHFIYVFIPLTIAAIFSPMFSCEAVLRSSSLWCICYAWQHCNI